MSLFNKVKLLLFSCVVTLKSKKVLCDCGGSIKPKLREGQPSYTSIMVYSRDGSKKDAIYQILQF